MPRSAAFETRDTSSRRAAGSSAGASARAAAASPAVTAAARSSRVRAAATGSAPGGDGDGRRATYGSSRTEVQVTAPTTSRTATASTTSQRRGRPEMDGAGSARADRADERHGVQPGDGHVGARVGRVDDHPVADVHADVADRAVVEDQVPRPQVAGRDAGAGAELRARRVREPDAG